jgi:hypothetical protein
MFEIADKEEAMGYNEHSDFGRIVTNAPMSQRFSPFGISLNGHIRGIQKITCLDVVFPSVLRLIIKNKQMQ